MALMQQRLAHEPDTATAYHRAAHEAYLQARAGVW